MVAACVNLAVAAGVFALLRKTPERENFAAPVPMQANRLHTIALLLYCMAGGIALGYEVIWSQAIVPFMSTRSFAFAVVLATYLGGLMIGSALYARFADRLQDPWGAFALLISLAGLFAFLLVVGLGYWLVVLQTQAEALVFSVTGSIFAGICARFAVAAACVGFVSTLLLGAAFPVALRVAGGARRIWGAGGGGV